MLSICIPVFNYNISALINELLVQLRKINTSYEILVIDDGSDKKYRKKNEQAIEHTNYIQIEKNIGRAKIRNKFLEIANYDYLLFIDNDSRIISKNYIQNYIDEILRNPNLIIFGGRIFGKKPLDRKNILRWKYGIKIESQVASIRKLSPNKSFMTNNFLIHRSLFEKVGFNEKLLEYGHEDTLFGYELKKLSVQIKHIDNPVLNGDYESNEQYLIKTEKAILNLIYMIEYTKNDPVFINEIRLLRFHQKLIRLKIAWIIRCIFMLSKTLIKSMLINGIASIGLFSFYKLGFLMINDKHY